MLSLLGKVATSFQRLVKLKFQQSKKLAAVQVQRSSKCLQISTTASSGSAALARVSGGFQARALYIRGRVAWQEHRRVAGRRALFASDPPSHVMHLLKLQCIAFQCMQMRIQLCNLTARIIMNLHHLTCERLTSFVSVPPQIFASEHFSYMWIADYLKIAAFAM